MLKFFLKVIRDFPAYLWSGWGALASVLLFIAAWDLGAQHYGSLVLPTPMETFGVVIEMLKTPQVIDEILITTQRAVIGVVISVVIGSVLGLVAGLFSTASIMSRPIVTILMGMPPIAWIVLAMLWFGMTDNSIVFTIVVSSFPLVFVGALQGTRTLEGYLKEMAESFNLPPLMKFTDIYAPHIFSYIFPAWVSALGMSWKIVVMAELMAANEGVGSMLTIARSHLDTSTTLALVLVMVILLMAIEYIVLEPIKRELELWRA